MLNIISKNLTPKEENYISKLISKKFELFNQKTKNELNLSCLINKDKHQYHLVLEGKNKKDSYHLHSTSSKIGKLMHDIYHKFNKQLEKNKKN